ncbi:dihydrodipicolinate synthase family protein [Saccharibacillus brassicae]|uniref:Dihydrodipicolinate synthase family protein n=1 Tax=Saccharibacillus brassicae TaxID=2583377 RepID=A0A4Y6V3Y5_SACBS|nr:dihydrodipicolinate synthase family protein [Saccharibacillus brassicae]QDH23276.1 dihydrodipicolinate synthase family protein [Saccharibacillus brassicae]
MFTGLSAFPLTPLIQDTVDEKAFAALIDRLAAAEVHSIGVLGSTGSYMYLDREERRRTVELAVRQAQGVPVMAGIGALRTRDVLRLADDAQRAGAAAVLLAPVSYQPLTDEEVYALYAQVSRHLSVPLCVYDNPRTTRFAFGDELHARIAELPQVRSVKLPGVPDDAAQARVRVEALRALLPDAMRIGVSGDRLGAAGLLAGCDVWYSVLGGLFPTACLDIVRSAQAGDAEKALRLSAELAPIWALFERHGSVRAAAAIAIRQGWMDASGLPLPLKPAALPEIRHIAPLLDRLG